jgi:hypothetical protein
LFHVPPDVFDGVQFRGIGRSLETRGYSAALVSARSRLRELSREVFALYMARRDVWHR